MAAKAPISSGYLLRLALVALVCLAYAAWSAYDGFVKYPEHNRSVAALEKVKEEHPTDWQPIWEKMAEENDWSKTPGELKSNFSMIAQYVQLGITLPIGLLFAFFWLAHRGKWMATDETGVLTSAGQRVSFDAIQRVDKQRWATKGIALVWHQDGGVEKKLVIDDWKYERGPTDDILREIELHLTREQIVNGEPEPVDDNAPLPGVSDSQS